MSNQRLDQGVKPPFWQRKGGTIAFLIGMACIGFLVQFQVVGIVAVTLYAGVMLNMRLPARVTFIVSLITFGMVPVAIMAGNWLIAQNFAAYTFLLFVWGVVALTADLQREIHQKK